VCKSVSDLDILWDAISLASGENGQEVTILERGMVYAEQMLSRAGILKNSRLANVIHRKM
jgi:hypothetical protein